MTFGERLKELRQDNDETQAEIGKLLNIGARMISHYEKDEHFPREAEAIILLAKHFNVTTDYLLGITNIKNYDKFLEFLTDYNKLCDENKREFHKFAKYLLFKEQQNRG